MHHSTLCHGFSSYRLRRSIVFVVTSSSSSHRLHRLRRLYFLHFLHFLHPLHLLQRLHRPQHEFRASRTCRMRDLLPVQRQHSSSWHLPRPELSIPAPAVFVDFFPSSLTVIIGLNRVFMPVVCYQSCCRAFPLESPPPFKPTFARPSHPRLPLLHRHVLVTTYLRYVSVAPAIDVRSGSGPRKEYLKGGHLLLCSDFFLPSITSLIPSRLLPSALIPSSLFH